MSLFVLAILLAAQTDPAVATPPKPPKEKKICVAQQKTGSQFSTTICHTKSEWAQIDLINDRNNDSFRNQRRGQSQADLAARSN